MLSRHRCRALLITSGSASSRVGVIKEGGKHKAQGFAAMHRTRELRSSLENSRAWKRQLETQLSEFAGVIDNPDPQQEHQIRALRSDLESAENHVSSLQRQLDDLMD